MKFDKKGKNFDSYNSGLMKDNSGLMKDNSGLMKDEGGHGPKRTAMSNMWGGESVEMGKQMGANRDFLKGPGSKHRNNESTFNAEHSGIVKQGMDSGLYKMTSGLHRVDSGLHRIEGGATAGAMGTLQDSRDKENKMKDAGMEELGAGLEDVQEAVESEPEGGDADVYTEDVADLETIKGQDEDLTSVEHDSEYDNEMRSRYGY